MGCNCTPDSYRLYNYYRFAGNVRFLDYPTSLTQIWTCYSCGTLITQIHFSFKVNAVLGMLVSWNTQLGMSFLEIPRISVPITTPSTFGFA